MKQFTPCRACGALGEIHTNCQFCGTTIAVLEGSIPTTSRIVSYRTVTPKEYADKISIFKDVEQIRNMATVSIGNQVGVVNLNGDFIYPLQSEYYVRIASDTSIYIQSKNNDTTNCLCLKSDPYKYRIEYSIKLGTLLNLDTLSECQGVEADRDGKFWLWNSAKCIGEVCPHTHNIIGEPSEERTVEYITLRYALEIRDKELEKLAKVKEEQILQRKEEERKLIEREETLSALKWIITAIIFIIIFWILAYI